MQFTPKWGSYSLGLSTGIIMLGLFAIGTSLLSLISSGGDNKEIDSNETVPNVEKEKGDEFGSFQGGGNKEELGKEDQSKSLGISNKKPEQELEDEKTFHEPISEKQTNEKDLEITEENK